MTAAEMIRNFGHWQAKAMAQPVLLTHHGEPRLVLMSVQAFEAATGSAVQVPNRPSGAAEVYPLLLNNMDEGFVAYDEDLRITEANPAAETIIGKSRAELVGRTFEEAFPAGVGSIFHDRLKRSLSAGLDFRFETPSRARSDVMVAARTFPIPGGVGIVLQNVTERDHLDHHDSLHRALVDALDAHGTAATATLDGRGRIKTTRGALAGWLGMDEAELAEARLADLVRPSDGPALAQAMEAAWDGHGPQAIELALLQRGGGELPVRATFSPVVRDQAIQALLMLAIQEDKGDEAAG